MKKLDFTKVLAKQLKNRDNPVDLKPSLTGIVQQVEPVIVSIEDGAIFLEEGDELLISEWFRFRCNIDKTAVLSESVPENCSNAEQVTEVHSQGGASCNMPSAISYLSSAIQGVAQEVLALKCELKVGDIVSLTSLEQTDKYILIDKVMG